MKRKILTVGACALLVMSTAFANDIYKYTDENGTVHYVDRPTGAPSEERVAFVSQRNQSSAPRGDANGPDWRERRQARQEDQKTADQEASDKAERDKLCKEYRDRLQSYNASRRLYRNNEQGERVYLGDEEIAEAKKRVSDLIQENCVS